LKPDDCYNTSGFKFILEYTSLMGSKKNTLLWKIQGDHVSHTSYLFGTMHVKDQRAFGYSDLVFEKMLKCKALATEFNLDEMKQNASANFMDLPKGMSLKALMRPKNYKKVNKVFKRLTGLDLSLLDNSQPLLITNLLSERILTQDMPFSLDETLWNFANQNGMVTLGIETFEEQKEILKKIPLDYQVKSLNSIGKNFKNFSRQLLKMTKLYENGDIRQLYKNLKKEGGKMKKVLLYNRNHIMAERIALMIQEQSTFCAIGAGHLSGKNGVIRLLKLQGLKVKPVHASKNIHN